MGRGLEGEGGARSNEAQSGGAENETATQRVNYGSSVWVGWKARNKEINLYAGEYWGKCGSNSLCVLIQLPVVGYSDNLGC